MTAIALNLEQLTERIRQREGGRRQEVGGREEEDFKLMPYALCLLPSLQLDEEGGKTKGYLCPMPFAFYLPYS